ncbi:hypothetical protein [Streptomyces sp. MAR25Y5]|uniref:hypothetical protein n=1 Tax=Streptomyces sp. MAR25Y5 TaxID=2962028 RepID=UPI0027E5B980|nr:hypothetical protein [Streptomyces sp. MAR25Y5]
MDRAADQVEQDVSGLVGGPGSVSCQPASDEAIAFLAELEPLQQITGGIRSILCYDAQADAVLTLGWVMMAVGLAAAAPFGFSVTGGCDRKGCIASPPSRSLRKPPSRRRGTRLTRTGPHSIRRGRICSLEDADAFFHTADSACNLLRA